MLGYKQLGSKAVLFGSLLLSGLFQSTAAANTTAVASSVYTNGNGANKVVVALNVPEGASNADLYFHFQAPSNGVSWAGFGMGSGMAGALMFIVYRPSDNSSEPTISPRIGSGHIMPLLTEAVNITLLEGSQVTSDSFIANFHCHNCRNWNGGSLDLTSNSAPFIYAIGPNDDLASNAKDAKIGQHSTSQNGWSLNVVQATGTNGVPTVDTVPAGGNSGSSDSNSGSDNDTTVIVMSVGMILHGVVMTLAFGLIYPLGYLFLRLFERVWLHAGFQSFALLLTLMGVGAGITVSKHESISPKLTHPHQIIGLVTFALILITWTVGLIAHAQFRKNRVPSPLMKGHKIVGPLSIALGSINACLGFAWVGLRHAMISYIVVALAIAALVNGLVFMKNKKKARRAAAANTATAVNFREGGNVAMQDMQAEGHGKVEYYNVQAGQK